MNNEITNYRNNYIISSSNGSADIEFGFLSKLKHNKASLGYKYNKYEALVLAVKCGELSIVKYICEHELIKDLNCNADLVLIIDMAKKCQQFEILHYITDLYIKNVIINYKNNHRYNYHHNYDHDDFKYNRLVNNKLVLATVKYASKETILKLCRLPLTYFDPNFNNNVILKKVTILGNFEIFIYLFKLALSKNKFSESNVSFQNTMNKIYKLASVHGHVSIIKYLLKYPDLKEIKKIDIQIILIILKEISSRPFLENKITHIECYDLMDYLLDNNLHRISIEDLLLIVDKINNKINHLNYDKNKYKLFIEYIYKAINVQMIAICTMFFKKGLPIEGVGYNIATYLYKEKFGTDNIPNLHGKSNQKMPNHKLTNKLNKNYQTLYYISNQLVKKYQVNNIYNSPNDISDYKVNSKMKLRIKL